ncbi:hypothetical protein AAX05_06290 [Moraxella bovoculi]|uniref:Uncharacterized protein n=1 Tax=Moraxella bovoculi TaxID=386891 RepID=A0AAC8PVX4_9GAMM|nr:hypothetical protein [Moraxella bovoculi]AKG07569.1 hypothetical protein AAX06_04665 [Moraxella bovoculi]AKG09829.1 hypothetical protein AAX05_06290 [Moraxella bovoculi]AKG11748.1 hypothetical protein AAX07_06845 [Moraxella bovoculi]AKG13714.1 hypothetical protein AAX11_06375 [Moraxella bovoculi]
MLKEMLCLKSRDDRLFQVLANDDQSEIQLAFYDPDSQLHCQKAKELQEQGVHLVAMVGANDQRQLPECANAMICCDDKQLAVDAFVAMTGEEAVVQPLLMDLIYLLQGKVFHQQVVNGGGNRKEVLTRLTNEVVQTQSPSDVLILIRANRLSMDDLTFMMDANLGELDGCFYAVCDSVEYGDEVIVDLIYKVK